MKTLFPAILTTAVLGAVSLAQNTVPQTSNPGGQAQPQGQQSTVQSPMPPAANAPGNAAPRVAAGSVIPVELTKTVDAKKAKTGDEVDAKVTQDLKSGNGEVLLPKDTKVVGHVTEAQARNKEQRESQVMIAFDHAIVNGGDVQMPMSIQAIIAPTTLNSNNGNPGAENAPASSPAGGGMAPGSPNGRMTQGAQPQAPPTATGGDFPNNDASANGGRAPITAKTQGVVGIRDLTLAPATNAAQGSILTSDKSNVKLESGTLMLLRVNQ